MPVRDLGGSSRLKFYPGTRIKVRGAGRGYATAWAGGNYDLREYPADNFVILSDVGQARTFGGLAALRRYYAHKVGGSAELRAAANELYRQARKNARHLRRTGQFWRNVKKHVRENSREGVPVDYVVWNTDPAVGAIEFGFTKKEGGKRVQYHGSHAMRNAARGKLPEKNALKRRRSRANIERK